MRASSAASSAAAGDQPAGPGVYIYFLPLGTAAAGMPAAATPGAAVWHGRSWQVIASAFLPACLPPQLTHSSRCRPPGVQERVSPKATPHTAGTTAGATPSTHSGAATGPVRRGGWEGPAGSRGLPATLPGCVAGRAHHSAPLEASIVPLAGDLILPCCACTPPPLFPPSHRVLCKAGRLNLLLQRRRPGRAAAVCQPAGQQQRAVAGAEAGGHAGGG